MTVSSQVRVSNAARSTDTDWATKPKWTKTTTQSDKPFNVTGVESEEKTHTKSTIYEGKKKNTNALEHEKTDGWGKRRDALRRCSEGEKNRPGNMAAYTCNHGTRAQTRTHASRWLMLPILNITPQNSLLSRRLRKSPYPSASPPPTPSSSSYLQWSLLTHLATGLCCAFPNDELCISRCQFEKCNYHSDKADGLVLSGICCASIKWGGVKEMHLEISIYIHRYIGTYAQIYCVCASVCNTWKQYLGKKGRKNERLQRHKKKKSPGWSSPKTI